MYSERALNRARVVSVVAATLTALACGTNYGYSAWAPQFADQLKLSATQSNIIGVAGNIGMYASGIPAGLLVDHKGPRYGVLIGVLTIGPGYFAISRAYDGGEGSIGIGLLCLFSLMTGIGSCTAFSACIKAAAVNWPENRGTATAFPLSAFGLSAFFFTTLSSFAFPNNTHDFLLLLAIGTFGLIFVSMFFLRLIPRTTYATLPTNEPLEGRDSMFLHRTKSEDSRQSFERRYSTTLEPEPPKGSLSSSSQPEPPKTSDKHPDETSSLMAKSSVQNPIPEINDVEGCSHVLDIRGFKLIPELQFWLLFCSLGLLTGIGLMTINNIGNDVQALWRHWDDSVDSAYIRKHQVIHVSVLSFSNFCGRLLSGISSDIVVKTFHGSRYWNVFVSSVVFLIAQLCAVNVSNPNYLVLVSGFTGLAYGFLFGVFPSLVADAFGTAGLSQNWGTMTMACIIAGNVFNLVYGCVYDSHSSPSLDPSPGQPSGGRDCLDGIACYRKAYVVTLCASLLGIGISLWGVWHSQKSNKERRWSKVDLEHEG